MATEQPETEATGGTVKTASCIDATITTRRRRKPSKTYAMVARTTLHIRNSSAKAICTIKRLKICAIYHISFSLFLLYNNSI